MEILTQRKWDSPCVITLGKFDGIHSGHRYLLNKAKQTAVKNDLNLVVYAFDIKTNRYLSTIEDRINIFNQIGADGVYFEKFDNSFKNLSASDFFTNVLVKKFNTKHIVVGNDWRFGKNREGDITLLKELCEIWGVKLSATEKMKIGSEIVSSSKIRDYLDLGEIEKANLLLGREYTVCSQVIKGKMLGRIIGFPTINFIFDKNAMLPIRGVYVTKTYIDGIVYESMTNIGVNPTVENTNIQKVETHILNFNGDLYGKKVKISFLSKVRSEQSFESIELLKNQLHLDREYVKKYFDKIRV